MPNCRSPKERRWWAPPIEEDRRSAGALRRCPLSPRVALAFAVSNAGIRRGAMRLAQAPGLLARLRALGSNSAPRATQSAAFAARARSQRKHPNPVVLNAASASSGRRTGCGLALYQRPLSGNVPGAETHTRSHLTRAARSREPGASRRAVVCRSGCGEKAERQHLALLLNRRSRASPKALQRTFRRAASCCST